MLSCIWSDVLVKAGAMVTLTALRRKNKSNNSNQHVQHSVTCSLQERTHWVYSHFTWPIIEAWGDQPLAHCPPAHKWLSQISQAGALRESSSWYVACSLPPKSSPVSLLCPFPVTFSTTIAFPPCPSCASMPKSQCWWWPSLWNPHRCHCSLRDFVATLGTQWKTEVSLDMKIPLT